MSGINQLECLCLMFVYCMHFNLYVYYHHIYQNVQVRSLTV